MLEIHSQIKQSNSQQDAELQCPIRDNIKVEVGQVCSETNLYCYTAPYGAKVYYTFLRHN